MTREKDELITPQWLMTARKRRRKFVLYVLIVFGIFTVLAWWALPKIETELNKVRREVKGEVWKGTEEAETLASWAGVFKGFWVVIAVGCAVGIVMALTGRIDTLLPVLTFAVMAVGVAGVAFTFYAFYVPTLILLERATP